MRTELQPMNTQTAGINPDHLPPKALEIAECIGLPAFLKLVEWRGGTHIYIPENPKPGQQLDKIIGLDAARKLAYQFAARLEIPKCDAVARAALHAAIVKRRESGESELEVALDTGFTGRWIRKIYSRHCQAINSEQQELF